MQAAELFEQDTKSPEVAGGCWPERGLPRAPDVARRRCAGPCLPWPERFTVPFLPALPGETRRISGAGAGRARLGGEQGVDRSEVGAADRQEVPRLLQRSGAAGVMHRLGLSPQVPIRRVTERDEQGVTARKEATRAEVNEARRPSGVTSASRTRRASPDGRPKDASGANGNGAALRS
uniref:winged helix-turn-helix domain-containing protein n=1 Tax=Streptomyces herbicida TaxID=3065675 RepID=UPI00292D6A15|nr:winged helix-turn-helix domain-containing protein [Streptomyces sp. NEAU-HV9]